jgi:hypothetical protein
MSDDFDDDEWQAPFVLLPGDLARLDHQALQRLSPEQRTVQLEARKVLHRYVRDVLAAAHARNETGFNHPEWASWQYLIDLAELLVDDADPDL